MREDARERGMLEHIGEAAGMKRVPIVHAGT
jgi:hypothetical protein